jgi:hypothetical protein
MAIRLISICVTSPKASDADIFVPMCTILKTNPIFRVAVVTTDARLYAWDFDMGKALMRSESIASLLTSADNARNNPVNISRLNFAETGQLVGS